MVGRKNLKEQAETLAPKEEEVAEVVDMESVAESSEEVKEFEAEEEEVKESEAENVLTALMHILYNGRMYSPGEELPVYDSDMVNAWLEAKSAAWTYEE